MMNNEQFGGITCIVNSVALKLLYTVQKSYIMQF